MELRTTGELFSYIESFTNLEKAESLYRQETYRLERIRAWLARFGDPQEAPQVIHVAGSKGKGSTAALIAAVLTARGWKTGLYTSPHVESYLERIQVNGLPPEEGLLLKLGNRIRREIESLPGGAGTNALQPTTFEALTLLAFLCFREAGCSHAVIETGIGGRLDATNVVSPLCAVITPIELEHTEVLGPTLRHITREKGGIIKPGRPAFCGFQEAEVREVLAEVGREREAEILFLQDELERLGATCSPSGTQVRLKLRGDPERSFSLSLLGEFQAENAALAYLALSRSLPIPEQAYRLGFRRAALPARLELLSASPPLILDAAHTPRSVARVLDSFRRLFGPQGVLLFGAVAGKRIAEMALILAPAFEEVIITTPGGFKESRPLEVLQAFQALNPRARLIPAPQEALREALALARGRRPLLVTGSFYLAGEIKRSFRLRGQAP